MSSVILILIITLQSFDNVIKGFGHVLKFQMTDTVSLEQIQEAQLSQRDCTTLRVIEYFAKSFKVIQNYTVE